MELPRWGASSSGRAVFEPDAAAILVPAWRGWEVPNSLDQAKTPNPFEIQNYARSRVFVPNGIRMQIGPAFSTLEEKPGI